MIKILFVCHGNICRSPMAEFIMKDKLEKIGISNKYLVESRATSSEEIYNGIGNPVYPPAQRELLSHGIDCGDKRSQVYTLNDYDKFDIIIGMDKINLINMNRISNGDPKKKYRKMMSFTCRGGDVADPWFSGDFKKTYDDIYDATDGLIAELEGNRLLFTVDDKSKQ